MLHELFSQLRSATTASHRRLDGQLDLCGDRLTLDRYRSLLIRFYGMFVTLEPRLAAMRGLDDLPLGLDLTRCWRTTWLLEDFEALELSHGCILGIASSQCEGLVTTVPEALGCLYVVEGAGLGGQMIVPCVERQLGLTRTHGCRFFAGHGPGTGERWRRLRAGADDYARRTDTQAQIVQSAVEVFETFVNWFSERGEGDGDERRALVDRSVQH